MKKDDLKPAIHFHENDLPATVDLGNDIAVDCEMMGLSLMRDRLCLVQLRGRDTDIHLVRITKDQTQAPILKALLEDAKRVKFFHYARHDLGTLKHWLDIDVANVFCTKIASKLVRTYTPHHGLRANIQELLGVDLNKMQATTNWGVDSLPPEQLEYAASDVLYLHALKDHLIERLKEENRLEIAQACNAFLPARVALDLQDWYDMDIFSHS